MADAIVIRGVRKTFGAKVAVENLDLTIPEGSLYGLIGPNGAGKTTSIRMIMSIIFPDRGEISVLGRASAVESKDRIGYLPEERGLYRKMKVAPFLIYMARLKGVAEHGLSGKVRGWLERVGLGDASRKRCEELSKGMQQKVQFIASVLHEPDLIILDEPFSGLDPMNRRLLRELIDEQHRAGRTLIFSTHAMYEAEQLCDHLVMINRGHKVLDMGMDALWRRFDPKTVIIEPMEPAPGLERELERLPGVLQTKATENGVELKLTDSADPSELMALLVGKVRARRVELKRPSVEDIFIEMVEKSGGAGEELESLRTTVMAEREQAGVANV